MILRAHTWLNNSDLIANGVVPLGYIKPDDIVLDPTFGKGNWWNYYTPKNFVYSDIKMHGGLGVDFRKTPYNSNHFDVIAFDPPYISPGGRKTSTTGAFNNAFGIDACPATPTALHMMIVEGLIELHRVLKPRGILLLKCMNYVTSGKYEPAAYRLLAEANGLGFTLIDEFIHVGSPGPQPKRDTQKHTRSNYSVLFVFRKASQ